MYIGGSKIHFQNKYKKPKNK